MKKLHIMVSIYNVFINWSEMRPAADGRKLFLWCEALVLMDHSQLSETVCVQGGRGRPQSYLHTLGSWRLVQVQESEWYAVVCPCRWQWQQGNTWWWRRWGWSQWWRCRSAPSLSLADWTSSAATGSTSSVVLFWQGSKDVQLSLEVLGDDGT